MDQTKENETRLPPPTDGEPVDDDRETDQGTESRDDTRNEKMETASNPVPDAPHVAPESESETESADEIKNEKKRPEVQAADQPAGETAETANKYEGQGDAKSDAPGPDNAPGAEDSIASPAADPSDEDSRIADTGSEEADPEPPSESDDGIESAGDKSESAEDGKEAQPSEKSSDNEKEDVDPTRKASNDLSKFGGYKIGDENEDRDPAEETREPAGDDSPEKEQPGPQPDGAESELENVSEPEPVRKMPLAKAVVTVILLAAVFSGFFIFENKSNRKPARKATATEVDKPIGSKADYPKTAAAIQPDDPNYIYYAKVEEISVLRETLLRKEEEIDRLKSQYQEGIADLEKEIFDEMRSAKANTFWQALKNKRIEFALRTIQRRMAYMRQLNQPSEWIYKASEELLYLKRRVTVDLQVAEVASGIDMNLHMQRMNSAIEKYQPTADRLAVDMQDAPLASLEEIWEHIQIRNIQTVNGQAASRNKVISEQVCSGTFKRVTELSEISVQAAKCIAEMPGTDLFLNDLNEISPRAAKYLFQWKGSWLCLNGFRALSPRVANYLFQWDGGWISLNGLTEFPAEIGEALLQWQGKQLELMGLQYTNGSFDNIGIEYLARWERSGGKLFVPREVRDRIDAFNGDSA